MRKVNGRVALLYLLAPALVGAAALTNGMTLQPASRLWIKGTSTVRSSTVRTRRGRIVPNTSGASSIPSWRAIGVWIR